MGRGIEGILVRDVLGCTSRAASMYNAGIKKTVPIRLPHTPDLCDSRSTVLQFSHTKLCIHAIAISIPGSLRRLPNHQLPGAVVPGLPAELPHDYPELVMALHLITTLLNADEGMNCGDALATPITLLRQPLKVPPVLLTGRAKSNDTLARGSTTNIHDMPLVSTWPCTFSFCSGAAALPRT